MHLLLFIFSLSIVVFVLCWHGDNPKWIGKTICGGGRMGYQSAAFNRNMLNVNSWQTINAWGFHVMGASWQTAQGRKLEN